MVDPVPEVLPELVCVTDVDTLLEAVTVGEPVPERVPETVRETVGDRVPEPE